MNGSDIYLDFQLFAGRIIRLSDLIPHNKKDSITFIMTKADTMAHYLVNILTTF